MLPFVVDMAFSEHECEHAWNYFLPGHPECLLQGSGLSVDGECSPRLPHAVLVLLSTSPPYLIFSPAWCSLGNES